MENKKGRGRVTVGILGGAFNPPHEGHVALARAARDELSLDRVLFVPSASPPHKTIGGGLSFDDRLLLTELAVSSVSPEDARRRMPRCADTPGADRIERIVSAYADRYVKEHDPRLRVSDVERSLAAPTYTFDVVAALGRENPLWDMCLIMGMDQAVVFDTWYRYEELASMARICAAARPGYGDDSLLTKFSFITVFPFSELDVSSSEIRSHLSDAEGVPAMVAPPVWELYRLMLERGKA